MRAVYGLGRAMIGGFFLYNGIHHLASPDALTGYAAAKGVANPRQGVQATGALMLVAGASLMLGIKPKLGALGAFGFLAVASVQMHDFWNAADEAAKQSDLIQFSKNVALMGALLSYAGDGPA